MRFAGLFGTAVLAAALALFGNYVILALQTRARIKEERRAFVRGLHAETVDLVVDLDLFLRALRADAVAGARDESAVEREIAAKWEDDLLRRVRHARFGHPDPDVREATEAFDDAIWPFLVAARRAENPDLPVPPLTDEDRRTAVREVDLAMTELRRAVYAAPHRDVPKDLRYDGAELPSRLSRAVESKHKLGPSVPVSDDPS